VHFQVNGCPDESVHIPGFAERNSVSCGLIIWSWLMLCSATAHFAVRVSRNVSTVFDSDLNGSATLSNTNLAKFTWDVLYTQHS
jgi:hypothetical protein